MPPVPPRFHPLWPPGRSKGAFWTQCWPAASAHPPGPRPSRTHARPLPPPSLAPRALEGDLSDAVLAGRERAVASIRDQLAAYIEVADAAFGKLALQRRSQIYVQARGGALPGWRGVA